jgi:endonuclease YncB( thermonuclease family)
MKTFLFGCGLLVSFLFSLGVEQTRQENPPSKISFEFENECGSPVIESMAWSSVKGTVVRVIDGNSMKLVTNDGDNRIVNLVAIDTSSAKDAAYSRLSRLVLNRKVEVLVNPSKSKDHRLVGVVSLSRMDVNRELLEAGFAEYKEPPSYSVSGYTACSYRIVESKAREAKKGMWYRLNH